MNIIKYEFIQMQMNEDVVCQEVDWKERQNLYWTIKMPNQVHSTPKKKKRKYKIKALKSMDA